MKIFNVNFKVAFYGKWYHYIIPSRLTLKENPKAIYRWLWWNFSKVDNYEDLYKC